MAVYNLSAVVCWAKIYESEFYRNDYRFTVIPSTPAANTPYN